MRISDWSSDVCSSDLLKGIDNLRYFSAQSSSAGRVTITLTFEQGTDPDIAQVQVQNKLQAATALLPQEVQRQGVTVAKSAASRSEEHTSALQSLMRISYAVFCLQQKTTHLTIN